MGKVGNFGEEGWQFLTSSHGGDVEGVQRSGIQVPEVYTGYLRLRAIWVELDLPPPSRLDQLVHGGQKQGVNPLRPTLT